MADYLKDPGVRPDVITLAGSGEPTLNLGLGRIIREIKAMSQIPVAVLTNGALLYLPEVRRELAAADIVLPSLDAAREETYRAINRPLPELSLASSARRPHGLPPGVPGPALARSHAAQRIKRHRSGIGPSCAGPYEKSPRTRSSSTPRCGRWWMMPPAPLDQVEMEAAAAYLGGPVEVIASFDREDIVGLAGQDEDFVEMLSRRPMTAPDLSKALGLPLVQVVARLKRLQDSGRISHNRHHDEEFYRHQT